MCVHWKLFFNENKPKLTNYCMVVLKHGISQNDP